MIDLVQHPMTLAQRLAPRLSGPALLACWGLNAAVFVGLAYLGKHVFTDWIEPVIVGVVFLMPLFTLLVTLDWFHLRHSGPAGLKEGEVLPRLSWPARVLLGLFSLLAFGGAALELALPTRSQLVVAGGLFILGAIAAWAALTGRVPSTVVRV
jgi:hypothetical protein